MKHSVLLVQRGISSSTHHVSGKSLKQYGTATQSPTHAGVVLRMTLEDYMNAAHDLIGNTIAGQQWVPEFVPEAVGTVVEVCCVPAGCGLGEHGKPAKATYQSGRFFFCAAHAPNDAKPLFADSPAIGTFPEGVSKPNGVADVQAPIIDRGSGAQIQEGGLEAPREVITPTVGTAAENGEEAPRFGVERPVPMPTFATTKAPIAAKPPVTRLPDAPSPSPDTRPVVEVLNELVDNAVSRHMIEIRAMLGEALKGAPAPAPKKKTRQVAAKRPPTEFELLQHQARSLGINTFSKGRAALEAEIADRVSAAAPAAPAVTATEAESVFQT